MSRRGDAEEWTGFLADHRRALFVYARSLSGSDDAAADLIQEVLVRLLRQGRDPGVGVAYVLRCLRNQGVDARRRRARDGEALPEELPGANIFAGPSEREECRRVRSALEGLPSDAREIVVLRIYGELGFREIADLLEAPLATVTSRYRRALAELAERLDSEVSCV